MAELEKEDILEAVENLFRDYWAYKDYTKKFDLADFIKWLQSIN